MDCDDNHNNNSRSNTGHTLPPHDTPPPRRKVSTRASAKKFYVIDKIVALNCSDSEQLQRILCDARAAYHSWMVRSASDMTSGASVPCIGCHQIELRRCVRVTCLPRCFCVTFFADTRPSKRIL